MSDEQPLLGETALWLARDAYPELDVADYLHRLDTMAEEIHSRLENNAKTTDILSAVNAYLFEEQGFKGNMDDYYDPRNSYLNEVLDRRTGIPITLSLIYMELGRRLGLVLEGLSFPGHFLVICDLDDGHIVLDPFSEGISLSEDDLQYRLHRIMGDQAASRISLQKMLEPADKKDILIRLLHNLKLVHLKAKKYELSLQLVIRILEIKPGNINEIRDRGLIYQELECFTAALTDLKRYLANKPTAPDAMKVREKIIDLQKRVQEIH